MIKEMFFAATYLSNNIITNSFKKSFCIQQPSQFKHKQHNFLALFDM